MGFVHLHNHTEFSILDGAQKLDSMVDHVVELGQDAVAQTDHGSGAGWYKFSAACRKKNIKPIIGIEAYITVGGRDRMETADDFELVESGEEDGDFDPTQTDAQRLSGKTKKKFYEHLTLIAKNEAGWRNLVHMVNETTRSYKYKPRMDYNLLREHSEGIICLTGCLAGPVLGYAARSGLEAARIERKYREITAKNDEGRTFIGELLGLYAFYVDKGIAEEGSFPPTKIKDAPTFIADWKSLARDGFLPEKPSTKAKLNTDYRSLGDAAEDRMLSEAEGNLATLIDIFGRENTFVEIMEHGIPFESAALPILADMAEREGVRLVATNDAHYTHEDDCGHHDKLLKIQREGFSFNGSGYHLRSEEEMRELRPEPWWQDACDNTTIVADMCEDIVPLRDGGLPSFKMIRREHHGDIDASAYPDTPEGHADLLKEVIRHGLELKGMSLDDEIGGEVVRDRLNHEFGIVKLKGFIDYFLMVWDLLLWARANGIYVGRGRGSVAGSLMAYLCEISWVEPLRNGLLFERFLEENRPDYPDMDLDFEKRRRAEVLSYLIRTYGKDHVARIGTFAVSASKRTVKDVLRIYGAPVKLANQLTKLIPMDGAKPRSLNRLVQEPEGQPFLDKWREVGDKAAEALETALAIEGLTVGESIHACGTLISNRPLIDLIPLRKDVKKSDKDDVTDVTQWEAHDIESYGLLKLDILGLRNLDIVAEAIKNIQERRGETIDIDYGLPDPDDLDNPKVRKTYELLRAGKTAGVFQLESSGMTDLILRLSPDSFDDISALIALYRPGPMGANMHNLYADRKNGRERIDYSIFTDDRVEQEWIAGTLGSTYGTFVYQEQLMNLGTLFAGFDAVWRNKLRKATAKKLKSMLDEVGKEWFENYNREFADDEGNVISPKFSRKTADTMWSMMQASAEYLFNKAHSAAYGLLTYITAYLKANYTAEYCAAILAITDLGKPEKRRAAFSALRDEGIEILPPDVNRSKAETFPVDDSTVILGLSEIKGLKSAGAAIARERHFSSLSKPFTSLHDLVSRVVVDGKPILDTSDLAGLIESGACDGIIGGHRAGAMLVSRVARTADIPVPAMEWGVVEKSTRQRVRLGLSLGENPLTSVQDQLRAWRTPNDRRHGESGAQSLSRIPYEADQYFTTIGILAGYKERNIASGKMANITLEGTDTSLDGVMFNRAIATLNFVPEEGQIVAVSGYTRLNDFVPASRDDDDDQADLDVEGASVEIVQEVEPRLELSVNSMWLVDLDDPSTGELDRAPLSWSEAFEAMEESRPEDDEDDDTDPDDDPDDGSDDDSDDPAVEPEDDGMPMVFADPEPDEDDVEPAAASADAESYIPDYNAGWGQSYDPGEPYRRRAEPDEDEDEDEVSEPRRRVTEPNADDDDFSWLEDIQPAREEGRYDDAPEPRRQASSADADIAPIISIMQKQVASGKKVPILYLEPRAVMHSAYEATDPDICRRVQETMSTLDQSKRIMGDQEQITLIRDKTHAGTNNALRYILVRTTTKSDFDPRRLPPLFDTEDGKLEPSSLASLFDDGVVPRKNGTQ